MHRVERKAARGSRASFLEDRSDPEMAASCFQPALHHMFEIITCPNPEQLTCVAPSIKRAKS